MGQEKKKTKHLGDLTIWVRIFQPKEVKKNNFTGRVSSIYN